MAQEGKQMRVGACKGFAYQKLVVLANGKGYNVHQLCYFQKVKHHFPQESIHL